MYQNDTTPPKGVGQPQRQRSLLNLLTATPEDKYTKQHSTFDMHHPVVDRIYQWEQLKQDRLAYQRESQARAESAARSPSHRHRAASTSCTPEESDRFYAAQMQWLHKRQRSIASEQHKREEAGRAQERHAREQLVYTNAKSREMNAHKKAMAASVAQRAAVAAAADDNSTPSSDLYPLLSLQRPVDIDWTAPSQVRETKVKSAQAQEEARIQHMIAYYVKNKRPMVLPHEATSVRRSASRQSRPSPSLWRRETPRKQEKAEKAHHDSVSLSSSSASVPSFSELAGKPPLTSRSKASEDVPPVAPKLTPRSQKALLERLFYCHHYNDPLKKGKEGEGEGEGGEEAEEGFCPKHNFHTFYDHVCTFKPEINPDYVPLPWSTKWRKKQNEMLKPKTEAELAEEKRQQAIGRAQRRQQEIEFLLRQDLLAEARQAYMADLQEEKERRGEEAYKAECTFTPQLSPRAQRMKSSGRRGLSASPNAKAASIQEVSKLLEYVPEKATRKDILLYDDIRDVRLKKASPRKEQSSKNTSASRAQKNGTREVRATAINQGEEPKTNVPSETSLTLPSALSVSETSRSEDDAHSHTHKPSGHSERYYYPFRHDKSPSAEKDAQRMAEVVWRGMADHNDKKETPERGRAKLLSVLHFDKEDKKSNAQEVDWPSIPSLPIVVVNKKRDNSNNNIPSKKNNVRPSPPTAEEWPVPPTPSLPRTPTRTRSNTEESRLLALSDWWWTLVHYYYYYNEKNASSPYQTAPSTDPLFCYEVSPFAMDLPLELVLEAFQTLLDEKRKKQQQQQQQARFAYYTPPTGVTSLWREETQVKVAGIRLHYEAVAPPAAAAARAGTTAEVFLTDNHLLYTVYAVTETGGEESVLHGVSREKAMLHSHTNRDSHSHTYSFGKQLPMFISFSVFIDLHEWVQNLAEMVL